MMIRGPGGWDGCIVMMNNILQVTYFCVLAAWNRGMYFDQTENPGYVVEYLCEEEDTNIFR